MAWLVGHREPQGAETEMPDAIATAPVVDSTDTASWGAATEPPVTRIAAVGSAKLNGSKGSGTCRPCLDSGRQLSLWLKTQVSLEARLLLALG